ncbi:MAG: hypothetical protein P1V51_01850 [Deltaproteobacteria bacterium]|nr:hypothetical protein [Deltaproteobacteria bacterium]
MANPLAILPTSNTRNLPTALELMRQSGAGSDEISALTSAGSRIELAWVSSGRPEWMLRLAWLLGADRRVLVGVLLSALSEAAAGLELPAPLAELLERLPGWLRGEVGMDELWDLLEAVNELEDEVDRHHPSPRALLTWAAELATWAAGAAESTDRRRWELSRLEAEPEEGLAKILPFPGVEEGTTLPELIHEGAEHAAAALRLALEARGERGLPAELDGAGIPWTPRAAAARRAADGLRALLPAGLLLRRLSVASLSPAANWID